MEEGPAAIAATYKEMSVRHKPQGRRQIYDAAKTPGRNGDSAGRMHDRVHSCTGRVPEEDTQRYGPWSPAFCTEDAAGQGAAITVELSEAGGGEVERRSLLPACQSSEPARLPAPPAHEDFRVSLPPVRSSRVPAGGEDCEAWVQRTDSAVLKSSKSSSTADSAAASTSSLASHAVAAQSCYAATSPRRPRVRATLARPASRVQVDLQGPEVSHDTRARVGSSTSHSGFTVNARGVAVGTGAELVNATATACGAAVAGGPSATHAVARPVSLAAAIDGGPTAVSEGAFCAASSGRAVSCKKRNGLGAEHTGAAMVPRGFSLAHIPAGILWGRPRVGALRLLYKRAGNPDRLLLFGPNWSFAVAMFFLHVLGITCFLYIFRTEYEEHYWLFAGGVLLCLVTLAAFLSTVFKDPGLPLKASVAELQPQLLRPVTTRLRLQKASRRQVQQRVPHVLQGGLRLSKVRENRMYKRKRALAAHLTGRREMQRHPLPSTEQGSITCKRRDSFDDRDYPIRGDTRTTESAVRAEQRSRLDSSKGSISGSSRSSGRSSTEDECTTSHNGDSGVTSDSSDSNDESDSSNCTTEVMSDTGYRGREASDKTWEAAHIISEENLTGRRLAQVTYNKRVQQVIRPMKGFLRRYTHAQRDPAASTCSIQVREKHQPQSDAACATVVGKQTGDLRHVFSSRGTNTNARRSAPHPLYSACESAVKLGVQFFLFRKKRQLARRGQLIRRLARFSTLGIHMRRKNDIGFDASLTNAHLNGYSAVPVMQETPCFAQPVSRRYGRRDVFRDVECSRVQKAQGNHELVENDVEADDTDSLYSRFCVICRIVPPPGAYHCEECRVCIEGYDHHCPWTSKCVGKGNTREFYTWILCTLLTVLYFGMAMMLLQKDDKVDVGGGETRDADTRAYS